MGPNISFRGEPILGGSKLNVTGYRDYAVGKGNSHMRFYDVTSWSYVNLDDPVFGIGSLNAFAERQLLYRLTMAFVLARREHLVVN